jgi:phosphatidylserine/phosphatidylglycerophosphate/cardiolipin synthase-like enzyme
MGRRRILAGLFVIVLVVGAVAVLAAGEPLWLFTTNTATTGPSVAVNTMEEALLVRLDGATTSIDAAIYDFDRTSVRDALVAAAGRGVTVRVVTDDETYAGDPHYADLEAAGITVVNDDRSPIMHNKFFIIDGEIVWTGSTNITNNGFSYNHNNSLVFTSTLLADVYGLEFEEMFVEGKFGTAKTDNVTHTLDYNGIPLEVYFSSTDFFRGGAGCAGQLARAAPGSGWGPVMRIVTRNG